MDTRQVVDDWTARFGSVPPVGHLCRDALRDRWLRIHSLPDSRRYPESPAEYAEMLRRQHCVASEVLGDGSPCLLFVARFQAPDPGAPAPSLQWAPEVRFQWIQELGVAASPARVPGDEDPIAIAAAPVTWSPEAFTPLITAAAEDRSGQLLFANLGSGQAYHPYDGGADLFLASSEQVPPLRERWAGWLSRHPAGL